MRAEIDIERVGLMGQGVGYDSAGNIYFVKGAVPGDRICVEYGESPKKYRDAKLVEWIRQSPDRRAAPCKYFGTCGGCDWLDWDYQAQLKAKDSILKHVLERGDIVPRKFIEILGAPEIYGYRNRIQIRQEGGRLGFYKKRSHEIVDIDQCFVAHPRLNERLRTLREEGGESRFRKLEIFLAEDDSVGEEINSPHGTSGFRQINSTQNEVLKQRVARYVSLSGTTRVLELFCGEGNLTFGYLPDVGAALGIDSNSRAIARAVERKLLTEFADRVGFFAMDIDASLVRKLPAEMRGHYDTLILDPPRQGVGVGLESFNHSNLKTIIYVSCSPISFSSDAQRLKRGGFSVEEIGAIDMFPHTRHIEFVAQFLRCA